MKMQQEMHENTASRVDVSLEELGDVLIAISVVAKRLAQKIYENSESMEGETSCTKTTD
jgi:hypothetical protein